MLQIECLTSTTQQHKSKEKEGNTKEEITHITASLTVNEDDSKEESREDNQRKVDIETQRHNPCRESCTDIGTHNDRNSLRKGKKSGIHKAYRHNSCC